MGSCDRVAVPGDTLVEEGLLSFLMGADSCTGGRNRSSLAAVRNKKLLLAQSTGAPAELLYAWAASACTATPRFLAGAAAEQPLREAAKLLMPSCESEQIGCHEQQIRKACSRLRHGLKRDTR